MNKCRYGAKSLYWDDDLQEEIDYIQCTVQFELDYDDNPYCGTDYECVLNDEEVNKCPIYKLQQENQQLKEQLKQRDEVIKKLEKWLNQKWRQLFAKIYVSDVVKKLNKLKGVQ